MRRKSVNPYIRHDEQVILAVAFALMAGMFIGMLATLATVL